MHSWLDSVLLQLFCISHIALYCNAHFNDTNTTNPNQSISPVRILSNGSHSDFIADAYDGLFGGIAHTIDCNWGYEVDCYSNCQLQCRPCIMYAYGGGNSIGGCSRCVDRSMSNCKDPDDDKCRTGQCSWYLTCVEQIIPCGGTNADYATSFGYYYCMRYAHRASLDYFSPKAVEWIRSVRRCLQDALMPLVTDAHTSSITCQQVKDAAFASHVHCYLNSGDGICALSGSDLMQLIWTIKYSIVQATFHTVMQMMEIIQACSEKSTM
jgi:hypothetical protein